jgi:hypothetical protein
MYLTKSDFKLACTCPTKLFYRRSGAFPASGDDHLRLLAEGGYMVEEMARQLHPGGRTVGPCGTPEEEAERTRRELERGDCVLYEATFLAGRLLARVDVLVRRGDQVELVEVKSGSFPGEEQRARLAEGRPGVFRGKRPPHPIGAKWRERLEDAAFQTLVVRAALPGVRVTPFLMMPDTSVPADVEGLWRWFEVEGAAGGGGRPEVRFRGDAGRLRARPLLAKVEVGAEVDELLEEVERRATAFAGSLFPELRRVETPLSLHCADCELHETREDGGRRWFAGCWGELGEVRPHLFDLYAVGQVGRPPVADALIAAGRVSLYDLDESHLVNADGEAGARGARQLVQLRNTRIGREWVSEALPGALDAFAYPLRFIDFETSALAIPYHAGMRPYETVAFQWSCHTVAEPGAAPVHEAWINDEDAFPNFRFAQSLRRAVGTGGTVFMWAVHERTTLRQVRAQLAARGEEDAGLAAWMEGLEGRLVDMNELTLRHYFHPRMGGRTSLKPVAEAVWCENPAVRAAFPEYAGADGVPASPYAALPAAEVGGAPFPVREGTAAIRAYQEMLYGAGARSPADRAALRELLLRYCRLDTAAMMMVWMHWRGRRTQSVRPPAPTA